MQFRLDSGMRRAASLNFSKGIGYMIRLSFDTLAVGVTVTGRAEWATEAAPGVCLKKQGL